MKATVPAGDIPPPPARVVAYVDGYGNLKTTWSQPPAEPGTRVSVRIGPATLTAVVSDGTFEVPVGEVAFAPGSSGWTRRDGTAWRCYELFARGGSAAAAFGFPGSGAEVHVLR